MWGIRVLQRSITNGRYIDPVYELVCIYMYIYIHRDLSYGIRSHGHGSWQALRSWGGPTGKAAPVALAHRLVGSRPRRSRCCSFRLKAGKRPMSQFKDCKAGKFIYLRAGEPFVLFILLLIV